MNAVYSLFAATLLAGLDVLALVVITNNLGKNINPGKATVLAILLAGKLGFLGLAIFWLAKAPWFDLKGTIAGLAFPFVAVILYYGFKKTSFKKTELKNVD